MWKHISILIIGVLCRLSPRAPPFRILPLNARWHISSPSSSPGWLPDSLTDWLAVFSSPQNHPLVSIHHHPPQTMMMMTMRHSFARYVCIFLRLIDTIFAFVGKSQFCHPQRTTDRQWMEINGIHREHTGNIIVLCCGSWWLKMLLLLHRLGSHSSQGTDSPSVCHSYLAHIIGICPNPRPIPGPYYYCALYVRGTIIVPPTMCFLQIHPEPQPHLRYYYRLLWWFGSGKQDFCWLCCCCCRWRWWWWWQPISTIT